MPPAGCEPYVFALWHRCFPLQCVSGTCRTRYRFFIHQLSAFPGHWTRDRSLARPSQSAESRVRSAAVSTAGERRPEAPTTSAELGTNDVSGTRSDGRSSEAGARSEDRSIGPSSPQSGGSSEVRDSADRSAGGCGTPNGPTLKDMLRICCVVGHYLSSYVLIDQHC